MRKPTALALVFVAALAARPGAQAPGPVYDAVSIKPNTGDTFASGLIRELPDGGLIAPNILVMTLISRAYPPHVPADMVGLPEWSRRDRFDITATSTLARATGDERRAMLRAMLADRFKLVARIEPRERDVYELVLARAEGGLGTGLTPIATDCEAKYAADRAAAEAALAAGTPATPPQRMDPNAPAPPCMMRSMSGRVEGEGPMASLIQLMRPAVGREIVDKTGLKGSFRVTTAFEPVARLNSAIAPQPADLPTVFTAAQELGLKLQPAKAIKDTLIIERLERPAEN